MKLHDNIDVSFHQVDTENGDFFRIATALEYEWKGKNFIVPAGFESDGASVPQMFWATVSPRVDPRTLDAAIGHDYLYRNHPAGWTRAEADDFFYDYIRAHGLSWWKSQKAYWGLRLFGGSAWNANNK